MKNKFLLPVVVGLLFLSTSCAGLISGKTQNIFLRTSDGSDDVDVEILTPHGSQSATIPTTIVVPRNKAPITIKVKESNCYKESKTYVPSKYNVFLLADAIGGLFGLTGTSVDMSSGAAWAYEDNIFVDVKKNKNCK